MGSALGGVGAVGDDIGSIALQDPGNVLFTGNKVDHGDGAALLCQQVKHTGVRLLLAQRRDLRHGFSGVLLVFRPV